MIGRYKQFDRQLFNSHNEPAIDACFSYLAHSGLFVQNNSDMYGPDLVVYKGFKPSYYVECEVKLIWRPEQNKFPFPTIQLPERKKKFLSLGKPIEFWVLRSDYRMALIIPDFSLNDSLLVEVPNKFIQKGELFYQVPVESCILKDLSDSIQVPEINSDNK